MNFSEALNAVKLGNRVHRVGWNGRGMWIAMQKPDENSKMSLPYIFIQTTDSHFVPWVASQTDLFAEDWEIVV